MHSLYKITRHDCVCPWDGRACMSNTLILGLPEKYITHRYKAKNLKVILVFQTSAYGYPQ